MTAEVLCLNRKVKVVLTVEGALAFNLWREWSSARVQPAAMKAGDTLETELWQLFQIFGKSLYQGCRVPFQDNSITLPA